MEQRSVDDVLALLAERDRLLEAERERRCRWEKLEALLPALAEALDVREVFPRMSALIAEVVPHVTVAMALLTPDRRAVKIHVASNYDVRELPDYPFTSATEAITQSWRGFVMHDAEVLPGGVVRAQAREFGTRESSNIELRPGPEFVRLFSEFKLRSVLRVPIRIKEEPVGAISFGSDERAQYGEDDIELAARIADHLALALAHERLAEEGRRAARSEERERRLKERVDTLSEELESVSAHRAIGRSASWQQALQHATKVAATDTTVLITGESGTGKEVIARYVHRGSARARGPFVALNCAALPEQLLESELFGYERGAFTGAHISRAGKIEQAAGGVLFLDEVGEMTPVVQAKFLRVLQEREFQRLGGTKTLKADVRVVAATNRQPRAAIERGELREDLYYRLSVFEIALPPLRERQDDIPLLVDAFLAEIGRRIGRPASGISTEARNRLQAYHWPGNVRELRNAIERAVILCEGGVISSDHLPMAIGAFTPAVGSPPPSTPVAIEAPPASIASMERAMIEQELEKARFNKSKAAKALGITRQQLYVRMRRYRLE